MTKNNRIDDYLTTYNFFTNSIDFRIISSKMLERFKNVQSFQLNQLCNGKFYFSGQLREVLLLKYNLWSKFLYEVESCCIEHGPDLVKRDDLDFFLKMANITVGKFDEVVLNNQQHFSDDFMKIYTKTNVSLERYVCCEIDVLESTTIDVFFTELVNTIIKMLQYELIVIHEIQHLQTNSEIPVLIITEFNEHAFEVTNRCFCSERAKIYQECFGITEVCVNNYTIKPINPTVAENIEKLGIKINYKLSSRFDSVNVREFVTDDRRVKNTPVEFDRRLTNRRFFKRRGE